MPRFDLYGDLIVYETPMFQLRSNGRKIMFKLMADSRSMAFEFLTSKVVSAHRLGRLLGSFADAILIAFQTPHV